MSILKRLAVLAAAVGAVTVASAGTASAAIPDVVPVDHIDLELIHDIVINAPITVTDNILALLAPVDAN